MVFTTFLQLGTIEKALNTIWGVDKGSTVVRKLSDYVSVIILASVLLTIALSMGNQPLVQELLEKRLIEVADVPEHDVPARDPAEITPWHILRAMLHNGDDATTEFIEDFQSLATPPMRQVEAASQEVAGTKTMRQWLNGSSMDVTDQRQDGIVKDGF